MEKYGRGKEATDDNIIQPMPFACRITKATDTLRVYNTSFPLLQWLHKRASMLCNTCIVYLLKLSIYYLVSAMKVYFQAPGNNTCHLKVGNHLSVLYKPFLL